MRYLKFRITNFKGIKDTEVDLRTTTGANVFSLVGLNESGKTTILEAIHSFSPDYRTRSLRGKRVATDADEAKDRLPRHLLARFTGEIVVEATISADENDKQEIADYIKSENGIIVRPSSIPSQFNLKRSDIFNRGDYVETLTTFDFEILGKSTSKSKEKKIEGEARKTIYASLWNFAPDIAYHDSFIFDFPNRIYLTVRQGVNDWVYRAMFEDVLAAGRVSYELEDITRRIRSDNYKKSWLDFFTAWTDNDDKIRIQQIIDQASDTVTKTVFGKWNSIFGEEAGDKEIAIQFGVQEGRIYDPQSKTYLKSTKHDLYISLEIKDGTRRFPIQDRSLGFRWFFAFLLFTQFRAKRNNERPVLFLFDEPAANLHSAAQARLIDSFPEIATGNNMLIYSTHSHYMISPDWLEQTFIVTNAADAPGDSVIDSALVEDESLDIRAQLYRSFANEHPSDTSYFQPIIDRIEVQPSRFDISLPSVVLEGKSDFYVLRYAILLLSLDELRMIPATGSGSFDALVALGASWGTKFVFLLDADNSGLKERQRYALEHGARKEAICGLEDYVPEAKEIEDLLDAEARTIIANILDVSSLSKKLIMRFFQEQLAKREILPLGAGFEQRSKAVILGLKGSIDGL